MVAFIPQVNSQTELAAILGIDDDIVRSWIENAPDRFVSPYDVATITNWAIREGKYVLDESSPLFVALACEIAKRFDNDALDRLIPSGREPTREFAIALYQPRTAALFFDDIFTFQTGAPNDVVVFPRHEQFRSLCAQTFATSWLRASRFVYEQNMSQEEQAGMAVADHSLSLGSCPLSAKDIKAPLAVSMETFFAKTLTQLTEVPCVPVFSSKSACRSSEKSDRQTLVLVSLENLGVIDESKITWEQVTEIRQDNTSRQKLRRFWHWFDGQLADNDPRFIENAIAIKLEEYQLALQKHGIETATGTISSIFDTQSLSVAAAGYLGFELSGSVAVGGVVAALGAGVKVSTDYLKRRFDRSLLKKTSEIAYIHEIRSKVD